MMTKVNMALSSFPIAHGTDVSFHDGFRDLRRSKLRHGGIDINCRPLISPVIAAVTGMARVETSQRGGLMVILAFKADGHNFEILNTHLGAVTGVFPRLVVAGTEIGMVGATGTTAAPHLHFQVKQLLPRTILKTGKPAFVNRNPFSELRRLSHPGTGARRIAGPL
jgi:murein DD-endopeptidase MepM/ murein hydrolase activator NlpD